MRTPIGRSLGIALSVAVLAGVAPARPASAQCPPSWKEVKDIKESMTIYPHMVRGFAAPESTVLKAVRDAFVAAGFQLGVAPARSRMEADIDARLGLTRDSVIYAKPLKVNEIMSERPTTFGTNTHPFYNMEQLLAVVRPIEGQEVVLLTYVSGKSESRTNFINREGNDWRTGMNRNMNMFCDSTHYRGIMDRVAAGVTAK